MNCLFALPPITYDPDDHSTLTSRPRLQCLSALLYQLERRAGYMTSGIQGIFWTLHFLCGLAILQSDIRKVRMNYGLLNKHQCIYIYIYIYIICCYVVVINYFSTLARQCLTNNLYYTTTYKHVCICLYMYVYVNIYIYVYVYIHIYTYIQMQHTFF